MAQCEIELRAPKSSVPKHLPVSQQKPSLSRHHQSSISDHNPKSWPKPGLFIRDGSPKMPPPQPQPLVSFCSHLTAKAKNLMKELNGGGVRRHVLWGGSQTYFRTPITFLRCITVHCIKETHWAAYIPQRPRCDLYFFQAHHLSALGCHSK